MIFDSFKFGKIIFHKINKAMLREFHFKIREARLLPKRRLVLGIKTVLT